jgi:hypothetical protein
VLSDGDDDRLVVGGRVDGAHSVCTGGKTIGDYLGKDTTHGSTVDTLEEGESARIKGLSLTQTLGQVLNDKVGVTDDQAVTSYLLGSSKVVLLGVDEVAGRELADGHLDGEVRVGGDGAHVRGVDELGGGHVVNVGDRPDGSGVAGAGHDLLAVGEGEVGDGQAEVDKVVRGRERSDLTGGRNGLAIVVEAGGDNLRIEGCTSKTCQSEIRAAKKSHKNVLKDD